MTLEATRHQFNLGSLFLFTFLIGLNLAGAMAFKGALLIVTVGITWVTLAASDYRKTAVVVLLFWMFGLMPLLILVLSRWTA